MREKRWKLRKNNTCFTTDIIRRILFRGILERGYFVIFFVLGGYCLGGYCPRGGGGYSPDTMDTMHLKDRLVLFGSEGSSLTLPLLLLSLRIITLCHCSSTMTMDRLLVTVMALKGIYVPVCLYTLIYLYIDSFIEIEPQNWDKFLRWPEMLSLTV